MSKRIKLKEHLLYKKEIVKDDFDDFLQKQSQQSNTVNKVNVTRPEKIVKLKPKKNNNHTLEDDFDAFLLKMEKSNGSVSKSI